MKTAIEEAKKSGNTGDYQSDSNTCGRPGQHAAELKRRTRSILYTKHRIA